MTELYGFEEVRIMGELEVLGLTDWHSTDQSGKMWVAFV